MHFYIHSLPPDIPVSIPRSLSIPLLQVSTQLQLPPVMTYSDTVVYNWELVRPHLLDATPKLDNLRSSVLFTGTTDEEEFYLSSARIEFRGVEALELMRATMDEVFVGDAIANRRITTYLDRMTVIVGELTDLLTVLKTTCNPTIFYNDIRPWFRGVDSGYSNPIKNAWVFEGVGEAEYGGEGLEQPTELSGPSAGQSAFIHSLDEFFSVDQTPDHSSSPTSHANPSMLHRMRKYMPRHHRAFLSHLAANPRPLRTLVMTSGDDKLKSAFNDAVGALRKFRDAHMIIVALFIIGPARKAQKARAEALSKEGVEKTGEPLKGTGGTDLVKFLKHVRGQTSGALLE